jgi:hypothetical protein
MLLPPPFLFDFEFPVQPLDRLPAVRQSSKNPEGQPKKSTPIWTEAHRLPAISQLSQDKPFCQVDIGWHAGGIGLRFEVERLAIPPQSKKQSQPKQPFDTIRLWFDTRNTRNVHRASRFCHAFLLKIDLSDPANTPQFEHVAIDRAREPSFAGSPTPIPVAFDQTATAYTVELTISATRLHGFDPDQSKRLSFFYSAESWLAGGEELLRRQTLTVGAEFPFASDPSLWQTLVLDR